MKLRIILDGGREFIPAKDYTDENDFRLEFINGDKTGKESISIMCVDGEVVEVHPIHVNKVTKA